MQLRPIAADAPELAAALAAADLPTEDLTAGSGSFFAVEDAGRPIGFGGFELYGPDVLLRSMVVLPEFRGRGYGRAATEAMLARAAHGGARQAYLLTTTAEAFFEGAGFARVERSAAPASILGTTQATTICATAALLTRPLSAHD